MNNPMKNHAIRKRVIYLDMDGVIADFNAYTIKRLGKTLDAFSSSQVAWEAMSPYLEEVYASLDLMHDAEVLVKGVIELTDMHNCEYGVLTAVPKLNRTPLAKNHKIAWLDRHFPMLLDNFNIGPWAEHKQFHCQVGDILIDDSKLNIPQWIDRGGIGILHTSAEDSLEKLKLALSRDESA
jgi:5'(3')-deoxyribonucleotidase